MRRALRSDRDLDRAACRWRVENVEHRLGYVVGLNHLAAIQMFHRRNHRCVDKARQDDSDFDTLLSDFFV